jgi:hypothetical protein
MSTLLGDLQKTAIDHRLGGYPIRRSERIVNTLELKVNTVRTNRYILQLKKKGAP